MTSLGEYDIVFLGRSVDYDGSTYYMSSSHWKLLRGMAESFDNATYLCQTRFNRDTDKLVPIDQSIVELQANPVWKSASTPRKLASLRREWKSLLLNESEFVLYVYYPGFYSFLLSPLGFRRASFSMAHFGSDAIDTAGAAYTNSISDKMKHTVYRRAQNYVLSTADVVFATDPMMEQRYPWAADRIVESAPIIDFDRSDLMTASANPCENEPIWLLFVGVFRPVKGLEYLVEAFAMLRKADEYDYRLRLVGDGKEREAIERKVRSLGLEDVVEFTGYVDQKERLAEIYRNSDVFVIPSLKESVPRVTYEAASMGLPIVATKVGGIPAFINHRTNGYLVEPKNPTEIAEGIEMIVTDDDMRRQIIENLQSQVEWYLETDPVEQRVEILQKQLVKRALSG